MDKIIKKSYNVSFSDKDIRRLCEGKVNILEYSQLANMKTIDEMLQPHNACII